MAKATWNGVTLAESDDIAHVEGNAYFPKSAVNWDYFTESTETRPTFCHWKGIADYYDVTVNGETNPGCAWEYVKPYPASAIINDRIAFWNGVEITGGPEGPGMVEPLPSQRDGRTGWEALCWLIRHGEADSYSASEVEANTDIPESALKAAWEHEDVQRYATRYMWALEGGNGEPLRLVSTGMGPKAPQTS